MKILYINTYDPYEENFGGSVVTKVELELIKRYFEVDTLYSMPLKKRIYKLNPLRVLWDLLCNKSLKQASYSNLLKPFEFYRNYDLVWCNHDFSAYDYKKFLQLKIPFIVRKHNDEYKLIKGNGFFSNIEKIKIMKFENDLKKLSLCTLYLSDIEFNADEISKFKKMLLPPIIKKRQFELLNEKKIDLLCVSNFSWYPNYEGMKWFIEEVFPFINAKCSLHLIGKQSELFSGQDNIITHGYVDNIEEFYTNSKIFIAPILSGAGIKIKILEAMNNIVVITTNKGAEGLPNIYESNALVIANTEKEFAQSIDKLLSNQNKMKYYTMNANKWLDTYVSEDSWINFFNEIEKRIKR